MSSKSPRHPGTGATDPEHDGKGSVKRARQQLEAGVRPSQASSSSRKASRQQQWPLPASGLPPRNFSPTQHPGFKTPRGPPPARPPRPSECPSQLPSPSIYSMRNGARSETSINNNPRPAQSFSHPKLPHQRQPSHPSTNHVASPTSTVDMTSRISISTDELFRRSNVSTESSPSGVPAVPSQDPPAPPAIPRQLVAGLHAPHNSRRSRARRSSVSPIPESEELSNLRQTHESIASGGAVPSSWGSGPGAPEILGAYLDLDPDSDDEVVELQAPDNHTTIVRSASLGKRGKPTMRTITKSNLNPKESIPDLPSTYRHKEGKLDKAAADAVGLGIATSPAFDASNLAKRNSASTMSNESCIDPEKPRFARQDGAVMYSDMEKEKDVGTLPKETPKMSDTRPGGRKPPPLDLGAVRDAETRGSLSSLSDLIRRATQLASNLDRGKTASRIDLAEDENRKAAFGQGRRHSGSLSFMLASFPNPGSPTPDNRGSWPFFFSRSKPFNAESLRSDDDGPDEKHAQFRSRKCCGMPRKWFIVLCILLFILVVLAILIPVFLIAVPAQNANNNNSCSQTTPCQNGGVSVWSGVQCSCVCLNGYTGSQCAIAGDSSCVTSMVDNGTITKKATMGSALPVLFRESQAKFNINLDSVTIMALFSLNNASCTTENELVSFKEVNHNRSKSRRSTELPLDTDTVIQSSKTPSKSTDAMPTAANLAARSTAYSHGIVYDGSAGSPLSASGAAAPTQTPPSNTTTQSNTSTSNDMIKSPSGSTVIPETIVEFSQVAVLYILQRTGSFDSALWSESQISSYLTDSYSNATHPQIELLGTFGLDFENRTISVRTGS